MRFSLSRPLASSLLLFDCERARSCRRLARSLTTGLLPAFHRLQHALLSVLHVIEACLEARHGIATLQRAQDAPVLLVRLHEPVALHERMYAKQGKFLHQRAIYLEQPRVAGGAHDAVVEVEVELRKTREVLALRRAVHLCHVAIE